MKKMLSVLAALAVLCTSLVIPAANAENISIKEVNAYADEYYAEWPDLEAKSTQVKENGFVFNVFDGYAFVTGYEDNDATEIVIPEKINDVDVVGIKDHPFGMCHKLETITLPDTLKYFTWLDMTIPVTKAGSDEEAVPTVREVKISETNPNFTIQDGVLFSKDLKTLIGCPPALQYSFSKLPKETEAIGLFAFIGNTQIEKAVIPETVKTIRMRAFSGCAKLKSVELPKTITEIQADTFSYSTSLSEIKINGKLEGIGCSAFAGCSALKKFDIPSSVTYIGMKAFEDAGCIDDDEGIYYVGKWCVGSDTNKLTSVVLREDTVGIAEWSFILANRITEFYVPSSVKYMGLLFYQSSRGELTTVRFHAHSIHDNDFKGVKKMKDIYIYDADCVIEDSETSIPAKWKYIKDDTDYDQLISRENDSNTSSGNSASKSVYVAVNTTLIDLDDNSIVLPDSAPYNAGPVITADEKNTTVFTIDDAEEQPKTNAENEGDVVIHGFKGSTAEAYAKKYNRPFEILRDLKYDKDAKHEKFTEGDFEYMTDGEYAWLNACVNKDIKEAVIPDKANGMCVVGLVPDNLDKYFEGCTKLEKLTLNQHIDPNELIHMGTEDSPLKAYDIAPENDAPCQVIDGVVYSASGKGLLQVPNGTEGEFVMPDDVEVIAIEAFKNCKNITSVKMSKNLKSIGDIAFRRCSNLESVTLPDGLTSIGHYAFLGCNKLKKISLPNSLTSIGIQAFPESVITDTVNGVSYIDKWAVATDRDELPENITLKDDTVGIASGALYTEEKSTLNIPASVKYVSEEPYLSRFSRPNTVKLYGNKAFSRLLTYYNLKDVYFYDPECDLSDCTINESYSPVFVSSSDPEKTEYTVIHGYIGSTAEAYAKEHNRPFEEIKDENTILYGDANCNGSVDLSDAVLIMQCISNPDVYGMSGTAPVHMTKEGRTNGDVFGHDGLTVKDALTIQQYLLDLIHSLPAD